MITSTYGKYIHNQKTDKTSKNSSYNKKNGETSKKKRNYCVTGNVNNVYEKC